MSKKLTTEEFIEKAKAVHGYKYDYSLTEYVVNKEKIIIKCKIHGDFEQTPNSHLGGHGCDDCAIENKAFNRTKTTKEFIIQANKIHKNKYDYKNVEYINGKIKVKILCSKHGEFLQSPNGHLNGQGCDECGGTKILTTEKFIEKSKKIHKDKYDYSKIEYINNSTKVIIVCIEHGEFLQTPNKHLIGRGCKICYDERCTTDSFIKQAINIHGLKYDYSMVDYINAKTKIKIICQEHGIFEQYHYVHLKGSGCIECGESKGENKIKNFLTNKNINFVRQKIFDECRNIHLLKFDFYLSQYNTCIEYDGELHYKSFKFNGGEETLKGIQLRDKIKNKYCKKNDIKLIRIPYWNFKNIEEILENYFC